MSQNDISNDEFSMEMERIYMNSMQVMVNLLDPNKVVVEAARASGKTSEVTVNRIVRVADSMPAELSFLAHRTYVALLTNIWPNIQAAFPGRLRLTVVPVVCWNMALTILRESRRFQSISGSRVIQFLIPSIASCSGTVIISSW